MPRLHPLTIALLILGAVVIIILSYLVFTTWSDTRAPTTILHPTPDNLRLNDAVLLSIPADREDVVDIVSDTSSYVAFGVNEGPSYAMFGRVVDVAVDSLNQIYILDSEASTVHIYSIHGSYLSSFGSFGSGPGELYWPSSISLIENGNRAVVIDGDVTIFARKDSDIFRFDRTFRVDYPAFWEGGACYMNGFIYTLDYAPEASGVIHKYDLEGRHIDSFGSAYIADEPFVVSLLSDQGFLACSPSTNVVGWVRKFLPFLYGYSGEGSLLWVFRLDDFESAGALQGRTDDGRPSIRYPNEKEGQSFHSGLEVDDRGRFLWSFVTARHAPTSRGEGLIQIGHTFRIDPRTRNGTYWASTNAPVAIWNDNIAYKMDRPFPQVRVYKRKNRQGTESDQ